MPLPADPPNSFENDAWAHFESHAGQLHEVFEGEQLLLQEMDILGRINFHEALPHALHPDIHPDTYEIHYLLRGDLSWWVEDSTYKFGAGTALIVRAGERHGAWGDVLQPCHKFWTRVRLGQGGPMPGLGVEDSLAIKQALDEGPRNVRVKPDAIVPVFERLLEEHRRPSSVSPLICRSLLHILLAYLTRAIRHGDSLVDGSEQRFTYPVHRALQFIREREGEGDFSFHVADLAKVARMSEGAFRRRFADEVGFTPVGYLNYRRIGRSKRMLAKGMSVTEVAHSLCYCSSQYFATVFRKFTGMTPSEFLRQQG